MSPDQKTVSLIEEFHRKHRSGLATLMFTDLVGSVKLKARLGDVLAGGLIHKHHTLVRELLSKYPSAQEIGTAGDSFLLLFDSPSSAVRFGLQLHAALRVFAGETKEPIQDRIGIHVGEIFMEESATHAGKVNLIGIHVDTCARVMSLCEGGRILLTRFAFDNARQTLKGRKLDGMQPLRWAIHGHFELKGVAEPVEICEVGERGKVRFEPLAGSEKAKPVAGSSLLPGPLVEPEGEARTRREQAARHFRAQWRHGVLATGLALAAALVVMVTPMGRKLGEWSYDASYWVRRPVAPKEALIVYMDQASHIELRQKSGLPWDHAVHAQLIQRLTKAGAAAVVFDILFDTPQGKPTPRSPDDLLRSAALTNGRVFTAAIELPQKTSTPGLTPFRVYRPFDLLTTSGAVRYGIVETEPASDAAREHFRPRGDYGPELATLAQLVATNVAPPSPRARPGKLWLNFYGPQGAIRSMSYKDALQPSEARDRELKGRVVFVGVGRDVVYYTGGAGATPYARQSGDLFRTPYTRGPAADTPGVDINATACLNLIRGDWLETLGPLSQTLLYLLVGGGGAFLIGLLSPLWACVVGLVLAGAVGLCSVLLVWQNLVWFPWAVISGAQLPVAVLATALLRTERMRREKSQLQQALATQHTELLAKASQLRSVTEAETALDTTTPAIPDHTLYREIGRGAYGEVWLARGLGDIFRAVKVVRPTAFKSARPFEREFEGVKKFAPVSLSHPGLIKILYIGRNESAGWFYYIMELADDEVPDRPFDPETYTPSSLASRLRARKQLEAREAVRLGIKLSAALEYLHGHQLIHRDIKPANIMFLNGEPRLADVGLVTGAATADGSISAVGTPNYLAPEGSLSTASDIYSLGKLLYESAMGKPAGAYPELPTDLIQREGRAMLFKLNEVILEACASDPARRPSAAQFAAKLQAILD